MPLSRHLLNWVASNEVQSAASGSQHGASKGVMTTSSPNSFHNNLYRMTIPSPVMNRLTTLNDMPSPLYKTNQNSRFDFNTKGSLQLPKEQDLQRLHTQIEDSMPLDPIEKHDSQSYFRTVRRTSYKEIDNKLPQTWVMSGGDLKMKPLNSHLRESIVKSNLSNNNLLEESKSIMKSSLS